jgi:hypothetical protein
MYSELCAPNRSEPKIRIAIQPPRVVSPDKAFGYGFSTVLVSRAVEMSDCPSICSPPLFLKYRRVRDI